MVNLTHDTYVKPMQKAFVSFGIRKWFFDSHYSNSPILNLNACCSDCEINFKIVQSSHGA